MKSVLISIKPKWCELIANGRKLIEVRKTRPKLETPFKCYIYCTNDYRNRATKSNNCEFWVGKPLNDISKGRYFCNGKVIGEFVCSKIDRLAICGYSNSDKELRRVDDNFAAYDLDYDYLNKCRLSLGELKNYANGNGLYGWHISNLKIYNEPKDLDDFMAFGKTHCNQKNCGKCLYMGIDGICDVKDIGQPLTSPPQSWCYVEELEL